MKKVLLTTGVALLALATIVSAQGYTFNTNLTVGSTGADVVALQTWLMAQSYSIPAISSGAAAKGYFGSQTLAAVKAYQAANGIPNTGFVGPLTRAAINARGGAVAVNNCLSGWTAATYNGTSYCLPPGTSLPTGSVVVTPVTGTPGVITTPGVEGSISATQYNAGLPSTIYEGQTMVPVLAAKVEAKTSDVKIERVKLDLGTATSIYNKIYQKIYVTDGDTVLASSDLNSSTVVKGGTSATHYYITLAGMNLVVPKNGSKVLTIKVDVRPSIDTTDLSSNYTISFDTNGIRGVDGAGIDQYAGATTITRAQNVDATLTDSATLTISTNSSTPAKQDVVATAGSSEDEFSKLTTLVFDVKAEKDAVTITDVAVTIAKSGTGGATASTTAYLFDGNSELNSATVSAGTATISDSNGIITIPAGTTKTLTVKLDIAGANGTVSNFVTSIAAGGITSVNSVQDGVTESGSATGFQIGVRNVGPVITLVSKSVETKVTEGPASTGISTSTLTGNFVFKVKAVGGSIMLGTSQSTSSPFFASSTPVVGTKSFRIYKDGTEDTTLGASATSTQVTIPSICSTSGYVESCVLAEGGEVTIPVSISITNRTTAGASVTTGGNYAIGIRGLNWSGSTSSFMDGELDWITPSTYFK